MRCELSKFHRFSPHLTTPQTLVKQGFERKSEFRRLSLAELKERCSTSCFETVFLTLFHSRITSKESGFLQNRSVLSNLPQQRTGNTMTDCSSLSGESTTANIYQNIKLVSSLGSCQRLTNDQLSESQVRSTRRYLFY